jgi:hypothetical protein
MVLALAAIALAGCTQPEQEPDSIPLAAAFEVAGQVLTPAFNPIAQVQVVLDQPGTCTADGACTADLTTVTATTDSDGRFLLSGVWGGNVTLHLAHADYEARNESVAVPGDNVTITLTPVTRIVPFQQQFPFKGYIECGAEYLIITPSCDTVLTFAGVPPLFQTDSVLDFAAGDDWKTLVLDTWFDPAGQPGIAGLRVSAYAQGAADDLSEYERFTQAVGAGPFTLRIEPGADYDDAVSVPVEPVAFRMEYYPHGHADDTICDPVATGACFLGVGVAFRMEFEAVATVFYHETAPDGWSLLDEASA